MKRLGVRTNRVMHYLYPKIYWFYLVTDVFTIYLLNLSGHLNDVNFKFITSIIKTHSVAIRIEQRAIVRIAQNRNIVIDCNILLKMFM